MKIFAARIFSLLLPLFVFSQNVRSDGFHWVDRGICILEGRKYLGENAYEKAFDWDGKMSFNFRALAYKSESFRVYFMFQPVVARSYDRKIRVSGQVYHLAGSLQHEFSENLNTSFSLIHLSTHITQDIEHPFYGDLPKLPPGLLNDANVLSFGFSGTSSPETHIAWRWSVEIQPVDLALTEGFKNRHYIRPVYFLYERTTWANHILRNVISVEGELGDKKESIAKLETRFEFLNSSKEPRVQILINKFFAPYDISSSPRLGFFPAELALGIRFYFRY